MAEVVLGAITVPLLVLDGNIVIFLHVLKVRSNMIISLVCKINDHIILSYNIIHRITQKHYIEGRSHRFESGGRRAERAVAGVLGPPSGYNKSILYRYL